MPFWALYGFRLYYAVIIGANGTGVAILVIAIALYSYHAERNVKKIMKAIFLDRDGVVNELIYHQEIGIIDSPFTVEQFRLVPSVAAAVNRFHSMGYTVILVSNQPGIAKGHMSEATFRGIRNKMKRELAKEGAFLDGEYYCFHHPEAKVEKLGLNCECRKPKPGMLLQAAREMGVDLSRSWMIGDGLTDVKAGKLAGARTVLIGRMKCELCKLMDEDDSRADIVCPSLLEASRVIGSKVCAIQSGGLL